MDALRSTGDVEGAPRRWSVKAATLIALPALFAAANCATAVGLDPTFGSGRGYEPLAAAETQSDTVFAGAVPTENSFIVLGRRMSGARGVLLLQRYARDGTLDNSFGDQGTLTIDVPGESLAPRQIAVQASGRILVAAASDTQLHVWGLLPSGASDVAFGANGSLVVPVAAGAGSGANSVHLLNSGALIVVMQDAPAASLELSVYRYSVDGVTDLDFGTRGKRVLTGMGTGLSYTGVGANLIDDRIVVAMNNDSSGARVLFLLATDGAPDVLFGSGGSITPAALQGRSVKRITPLASNFFLVGSVGGVGTAVSSSVTRFDPFGRIDAQFAGTGTLQVAPATAGVAIEDVIEQLDNSLVVTASTPDGLLVSRYLPRGAVDLSFNGGNGALVVPEPASRATVAVASLSFGGAQLVHVGYGLGFGAVANPAAPPSRSFVISSVDGVLDTGYGGKGIVSLFGRKLTVGEVAQQVAPLADGRIMVLSGTGVGDGFKAVLSRYLPDGAADTTYGSGGRASFVRNGRCEWPLVLAMQADGKALVMSTSFDALDCNNSAIVAKRFTSTGIEDAFQLAYTGNVLHARSGGIAVQADGRIVITGQDGHALVVIRHLSDGQADTSFGSNGRALWQGSPGDDAKGGAVLIQPDQKIVAAGSVNGTHLIVVRYSSGGALDPAYGTNGATLSPVPGSFLEVQGAAWTSQGKLVVLARTGLHPVVAQFTGNGALDTTFGNGGMVTLLPVFVGGDQYARFGLAVQADGGIVVSGQSTGNASSDVLLARLSANGSPDSAFGPGGMLHWRPSAFFSAGAQGVATLPSGKLLAIGYGLPGAFMARLGVSSAVVAATVVEFYNTALNHYFITADPAEQAAVDAGAAGPGWSRTGQGFHAYAVASGVPPGQIPVCRFYGSTAIDPLTGLRRGPNSHFYTAQAAECAAVQRDPGWTLEGIAFYTQQPEATGLCAPGAVPVFRNYNNRAQFNDSNHRYTTELATYQQMQSLGWAAEGVVFCAAP